MESRTLWLTNRVSRWEWASGPGVEAPFSTHPPGPVIMRLPGLQFPLQIGVTTPTTGTSQLLCSLLPFSVNSREAERIQVFILCVHAFIRSHYPRGGMTL